MADNLDNEEIAWEMRARERALQRAAFEANQHAAREQNAFNNVPTGGAAALNHYYTAGPAVREAQLHAARANYNSNEASGDSAYAARAQAAQRESNLMKWEARRRQFDSETQRYGAETERHDSDNKLKAQMGHVSALNNMSSQMGNMFNGGGSGSQQPPGIGLYGAGGQRIGGSGMPRSPLQSLLE
jgi:hypothetical protein